MVRERAGWVGCGLVGRVRAGGPDGPAAGWRERERVRERAGRAVISGHMTESSVQR